MLETLDLVAWGDLPYVVFDFEDALRLALLATADDLKLWEAEAEARGWHDEFEVPPEDLANMSVEWQRAYVARLIATVALRYGMSTGDSAGPVGDIDRGVDSSAALLHALCDIALRPG